MCTCICYNYVVWCSINSLLWIFSYTFIIGSVAIPDGLQEELGFPISSAYKWVPVCVGNHFKTQYFSSVMTCNVLLRFYSARWVKMNGIEYKSNAWVVCSMNHDLPTVGKITSLLVINSDKLYFRVQLFSSLYIEHFRAYTLQPL